MVIAEVVAVLILLAVAVVSYSHWVNSRRETRLLSERSAESDQGFVDSFPLELRPIAKALLDELHPYYFRKTIPLRKTDNLRDLLNLDPHDLDDILSRLLQRFRCSKPTKHDVRFNTCSESIDALVRYVRQLQGQDDSGAAGTD